MHDAAERAARVRNTLQQQCDAPHEHQRAEDIELWIERSESDSRDAENADCSPQQPLAANRRRFGRDAWRRGLGLRSRK